jgi:hypothetical protein
MLSRKIAHQTHPLVYECKQLCWSLCEHGIEVNLVWIPAHVGLMGNELVDDRARHVALEVNIFDSSLFSSDFQILARPALMRAWQTKWDSTETGKFAHSIAPDVTLRPWFEGQQKKRRFVSTVSRVLSGHCSVRLHLWRFRIVEDLMCVCAGDYETVDHLIWHLLMRLPR